MVILSGFRWLSSDQAPAWVDYRFFFSTGQPNLNQSEASKLLSWLSKITSLASEFTISRNLRCDHPYRFYIQKCFYCTPFLHDQANTFKFQQFTLHLPFLNLQQITWSILFFSPQQQICHAFLSHCYSTKQLEGCFFFQNFFRHQIFFFFLLSCLVIFLLLFFSVWS